MTKVPGVSENGAIGTLSKGVEWIDDLGVRGMRIVRAGMVRTDKGAPVREHRNVTDHNILWAEVELERNTNV